MFTQIKRKEKFMNLKRNEHFLPYCCVKQSPIKPTTPTTPPAPGPTIPPAPGPTTPPAPGPTNPPAPGPTNPPAPGPTNPPAPTTPTPSGPGGPGGPFPTSGGIAAYYFIGNCPENGVSGMPQCLLDTNVKIILIAFANSTFGTSGTDNMKEDSFGPYYDVAKHLRDVGFKGIIQYSFGGQNGMIQVPTKTGYDNGQNLFKFFNSLSSSNIATLANTISTWKYVDGVDIDIEPAEDGGAVYTEDIIQNKVKPFCIAVKNSGRPVTSTTYGNFNGNVLKCHMPAAFSNIKGGVKADLMTIMAYQETVNGCLGYADNFIGKQSQYRVMGQTYPDSITTPLYNKEQLGIGLLGNVFKTDINIQYQAIKAKDYKWLAIWAVCPPGKIHITDPGCTCCVAPQCRTCTAGAYSSIVLPN
jgi:hypothetical protein